ncbi:energy transducer TonB [Marinihelvus fidelis]|uniref:Energy transducer TonB n=1 Tax=Marinihelvus fidelis TaxID=2613842 RepID=A0A5N0TAP9_9GAMM|nr:energy transducer TonB [Marinihelvus fidelis]KAA9130896.1 energy transducer TonB [Marinihelvus fidelis]
MKNKKSCLVALLSLAASMTAAADDVILIDVAQTTQAVAHEKPPIAYPAGTRANRLEAWVTVGFTIEADGTTSDIEIIDQSMERIFGDAAIEAVSEWTYDPATRDGEPVATRSTARVIFALRHQRDKVSNGLARRFKGISRELAEGDIDGAREGIEALDKLKHRSLADVVYMDFLRAEYFEKIGDDVQAREYLERALVVADIAVAPATYRQLLRSAMRLDAQAGLVADALAHYDDLIDSTGELPVTDPSAQLAVQLEQAIAGPEPIVLDADLEPCLYCLDDSPYAWSHQLARGRFSFAEIDAAGAQVEVWCGAQSARFTAEADLAYRVETGEDGCSLKVLGDQPVSFRFVELPQLN